MARRRRGRKPRSRTRPRGGAPKRTPAPEGPFRRIRARLPDGLVTPQQIVPRFSTFAGSDFVTLYDASGYTSVNLRCPGAGRITSPSGITVTIEESDDGITWCTAGERA